METNRGILSNNRPLTDKVLRNSPILAKWLMKIFIQTSDFTLAVRILRMLTVYNTADRWKQ